MRGLINRKEPLVESNDLVVQSGLDPRGFMRTDSEGGGELLKRTLLTAFLILVVSTPAAAQNGWLGLYAHDGHDIYAFCPKGGTYPIEMWIWCKPGDNGQICAEFSIDYPGNVIQSTVTWNYPIISVRLGDLVNGLGVCYNECRYDWHWIAHQALWVLDPTPGIVRIADHPDVGAYQIANCLPGYPVEQCYNWPNLYFNDPCPPEM
jgi:hypothetical protein